MEIKLTLLLLLVAVMLQGGKSGDLPTNFNLAYGRRIEASSTCGVGVSEKELFCKLTGANPDRTDDSFSQVIQGQLCDYCDPTDPARNHPPEFAIDGSERWWQSPPLSRGSQFNEVNLTIHLDQEFHVAYVYMRMGNSPRPGVFILERSTDFGKTWKPWQYFADTKSDCYTFFGHLGYDEHYSRDDSVICTTEFSQVVPLEGGEIIVSLVNQRPSALNFSYSQSLQEWTRATDIRFRFLRTKTLLGRLMAVAQSDVTVTRRYYYSVKDISIGGHCVCNGHAKHCDKQDARQPNKLICQCQHNTCGEHCGRCCPGFVQKKWKPATLGAPNECEPCQCHGHTTECTYDEEVASNHSSLDIHGRYEGGGVCHNCAHNTQGINCHQCKFGFFKPQGVDMNSPYACQRCKCDSRYSTGDCEDDTGRCLCRPEFAAPDCKSCSAGYYGYPNCKPCRCHINGTEGQVCDSGAGSCPCKPNYAGPNCDHCALNFFDFPTCAHCNCDPVGSQGNRCDPTTGQCICNPRYGGLNCGQCDHGFYDYPNCQYCTCDTTGSTDEVCAKDTGRCLCKDSYGGERCNQCSRGFHRFPYCIPCGCNEDGVEENICQDNGQCFCKPNFVGKICDQCAPGFYKYPECLPCNCLREGSHDVSCDQVTGQCQCKNNFEGVTCGECRPNYYNFPLCEECSCNPAGAKDIPGYPLGGCGLQSGGRLCHCKERVTGHHCEVCAPSYWKLSVDNPYGCEECDCDTRGTLGGGKSCDSHTGQCVCKPFVTGRRCDQCLPGTFNLQDHNLFGCQACKCDLGGSVDATCDESGQCNCKPRIQGKKCDTVLNAHYFPKLHQLKYELEDGRTRIDGPVRYGFDSSEFPDFSWKGYAVFSKLQDEVLFDVEVQKQGLYKLLYHYINIEGDQVQARVTATPDASVRDASEQSSNVVFKPLRNFTMASSGGGYESILFLNKGKWTFALNTFEKVLVDYMVLIPSAYYEASLLHSKFFPSCTVPSTHDMCKHYSYVDLNLYRGVKGADGRARVGSEFDQTQTFPNHEILHSLDLESMAYLNDEQSSLTVDVPVGRPGDYVFIVSYFTDDNERMQELGVDVVGTSDEDPAVLRIANCPYSSPCRQYIHDLSHNTKSFHVSSDHATLTLSGRSDVNVAIDHVYAIPIEQASPSLIEPKFKCLYRYEQCAQNLAKESLPGVKIKFKTDVMRSPPFNTTDPTTTLVQLHRSSPRVEVTAATNKPDDYSLVVLYYQPFIVGFDVDVLVHQNGRVQKGVLRADFCPSKTGCHATVTFKNHTEVRLSEPRTSFTFNSTSPVWLDYMLVVPSNSYNDKLLSDNTRSQDSNYFQDQCAGDFYQVLDTRPEHCKRQVFHLTTDYNNGALSCGCDVDGSEDFSCKEYGGQCACRAFIIGRTCSQCATGYWGFPNCRPCDCPQGLCDSKSGQCVCPPKVTGANCDTCLPSTFGFDSVIGCEDCDCDVNGVDGSTDCDTLTGECSCKPNVAGRRCDMCLAGHYNFPHCDACSCDVRGTTKDVCDQTTSQCFCKENVEGSYCDQCIDSAFFLESKNPKGCSKCFCSGVTTSCQSSSLRWHSINEREGWILSNVLEATVDDEGDELRVIHHELVQSELPVYWKAPPAYVGNKVASYGGRLKYTIYFEKGADAEAMYEPDVILEGGDMEISFASDVSVKAGEEHEAVVELIEGNFVHKATGNVVPRSQFMTVLARLEALYIRNTYYTHTSLFSIKDIELQVATQYGEGEDAHSVEVCQCPPSYAGSSCETCSPGYHRAQGQQLGVCVPCNCNGRASTCHPLTGVCQDCRDNFDGPECKECRQGFYHDARYDVCRPCSCPSTDPDKNFASTCDVSPSGTLERCYCLPGYIGVHCDRCASGYWGQPLEAGGSCMKCECNDNIDERDPGCCDQTTGQCLRCLGNTGGLACERCAEGYFGDAVLLKNCQRCNCDPVGTDHCDHVTGACVCKRNIHGPTCSQCVAGAFGFQSDRGCEMCECGAASLTNMCDTRTGQCECRTGVQGRKCDQCISGYWNYGTRGCQPCDCQSKGAMSCNPQTGACQCYPGVTGPNCDRCQPKWVMIEGSGCRECDSCIHLLVDDIEILDQNVTSMREELENVTMGVQAFKKLEAVNTSIVDLRPKVDEIINSESESSDLNQLKDTLSHVQELTEKVLVKSEQASRQCEGVSGDAVDMKKRANSLYDEILKKAVHDVNEAVAFVKTILATITGSNREGASIEHLVREAENILENIKSVSLEPEHKEATQELEKAADVLAKAKDLLDSANNQVNTTNSINLEIEEVLSRLFDLQNHTKISMETAHSVNELNSFVTNTKNHIAKMVDLIKNRREEFSKCMGNTNELLESSAEHIRNAKDSISGIQTEVMGLEKALKDVDAFSNDLSSHNNQLKTLVDDALSHASKLEKQSSDVQNLLTNTKSSAEAAIKASEAYQKIVDAIGDALAAFEEALQAAESAYELSDGLADRVVASKKRSDELRSETLSIYHKLEQDVKGKLNQITSTLQDIKQVVVKENVTEVLTGVADIRTKGLGDQAQNASRIAKQYLQVAEEAQEKIEKYEKITNEDSENLKNLPAKIREMNSNIHTAESGLDDVSRLVPLSNDLISELKSQADVLNQLQKTLKNNMDSLRNQIQVARDTANLINVGVNFTDDSYLQVRNVKQMNSAGLSASTSLSFKTQDANGLIYHIGNDKQEYMSLSLVDGHLVLKVNKGSGENELKSQKVYNDDKWYHMEVVRAGSNLDLVVMEDGQLVEETSKRFDADKQVLNFGLGTKFYVGGIPDADRATVSGILPHPRFSGCIDDLMFEDSRIGPWNFVHAHNIRGSKKPEKPIKKTPKEVKFGGSGYLIMDKERTDLKKRLSAAFSFRTFEKNGLLFFVGGKDYMSIELNDGKLNMKFDLGSGGVSVTSDDDFNTGEWVHVHAKRIDRNSFFKINGVAIKGRPRSPGTQKTLDVGHEIFVGGYKGRHNFSEVSNVPFKGCIKDFKLDINSRNLFENIEAKDISPGCVERAKLISFKPKSDNSYVTIDNAFSQNDGMLDISFKFRTDQSDALLLYAYKDGQKTVVSLAIVDKHLHLVVVVDDQRKQVTTLEPVDDANWHYVQLKGMGTNYKLTLDDTEVQELTTDSALDQSQLQHLHIGALPSGFVVVFDNLGSSEQYIGCFGDLSINSRPVDFSTVPVSQRVSVTLSSCYFHEAIAPQPPPFIFIDRPPQNRPTIIPQPPPQPTPSFNRCALPLNVGLKEAYTFGRHPESRMLQHRVQFKNSEISDYHFDFKTTASDGLIYYVASRDHKDFVAVYMRDGIINVAFNCGGGVARMSSIRKYNNGVWHPLQFKRNQKEGMMILDDSKEQVSLSAQGTPNSIEVVAPHYIGGLGGAVTAEVQANVDGVVQNFEGCLGKVKVDGVPLEPEEVVGVEKGCKGYTEDGLFFFNTNSLGVIQPNFNVPIKMDVSLEIKPRLLTAVLLSVHNPSTQEFLILQLLDGQLHFSMKHANSEVSTVFNAPTGNFFCDGNWHEIKASKVKNLLLLSVDGVKASPAYGEEGTFTINTNNPFLLGGVQEPHLGAKTTESYVGCIKNLFINRTPVSPSQVRVDRGRVEEMCPVD